MSEPPTDLPTVITVFQAAHDQHDVDVALATFTEDAVVRDDGSETLLTRSDRAL